MNCAWIDNGTDDGFYTDTTEMGLQGLGATQDEGDVGVKTNSKLGLSTVLRCLIYMYCMCTTNIDKHCTTNRDKYRARSRSGARESGTIHGDSRVLWALERLSKR